VNAQGAKLLGRSPGELLGRNIWDVYPEAGQAGAFEQLRQAMAGRVAVEFEEEYEPAGRSFEVRAYPAGEGMSIYFRDVTERAAARRFAALSQQLLADTGVTLSQSLDVDCTLNGFAGMLVPALGDCCILTERLESGVERQLAPAVRADMAGARLTTLQRLLADRPLGAEAVLAGRMGAVILNDSRARRRPGAEGVRALLAGTGMKAALVAPLCAQGRLMGTLTLLSDQRGRYGAAECGLAEELGRRAALALDNIRLYDTALLANRAKSDFLAIMSHELRTPLTTVMGYTDLLLGGVPAPLPAVSHRYVERVRMAAWHLLAIIEQILVYTRLDVGTEQVQRALVSAADVLHDAAALIEPVARDRGIAFTMVPVQEPIEFITDLTKLRQILLNLLSNAVRFTDEGGVSIEAARECDTVCFIIRDTGIGIAPGHLERVFEAFWQVDAADTRRSGGTGLGLSVARRLARLLGGDVTAESQPGAGTTFRVTLPLETPAPPRPLRGAERGPAEGEAK
jgi:signal transduction histidine kinase